jgi:hypothetical protein
MAGIDEIFSSQSENIRRNIREEEARKKEVVKNDDFQRTLKNRERQQQEQTKESQTQHARQSTNVFDLSKKSRADTKKSFIKEKDKDKGLEEETLESVFSSDEDEYEFDQLHQKIAGKKKESEFGDIDKSTPEESEVAASAKKEHPDDLFRAVKKEKRLNKETEGKAPSLSSEKQKKEISGKESPLPIWSDEEDVSMQKESFGAKNLEEKSESSLIRAQDKARATAPSKEKKPGLQQRQDQTVQADARNIPTGSAHMGQSEVQHRSKDEMAKEASRSSSAEISSDRREGISSKKKEKGKEFDSVSGREREYRGSAPLSPESQTVQFHVETPQQPKETNSASIIRDLVNQIVERIQVMEKANETKTQITLRHPSLLEGATITLTAFKSAKGEFNISFANLSGAGKSFLDKNLKEHSLADQLKSKGIVTHRITTSTEEEDLIA